MDGLLKELTKLEKLTTVNGKGISIIQSLDTLLQSLKEAREGFLKGTCSEEDLRRLAQLVEAKKKEVDDRQKDIYSVLSRLGKALDKKFTATLPTYSDLFASSASVMAIERTIALHLLRTGQFDVAETFLQESEIDISKDLRNQFVELHQILRHLRGHDIGPALRWAKKNQSFLRSRNSPLEFYLHRSQYIRLLLSTHPPDPIAAVQYARDNFRPFYNDHETEFRRLMACTAFLPLHVLQNSTYRDLADPTIHFDLEPLFAKEYCASLGMSRQVPLRVVGDIGGGGALARIEKGRKVMGDRKNDWNQMEELPIEIPLASDNRYHSIFACLVSKEQSTEANPPMMMTCGHVISKDSLQKLNKSGGRSKCPYCPVETMQGAAQRLYL
ncbi:E3 ubiquitin-protein ligase RMND5A [Psilocybe cubensis]|uniref:GID complex catalytic subunit 2 n=2 Tax=Psilocybe cubensis TaxID=181762 RepID=A0A8H7Y352_PSICU|nr:E3 ubiquitin-protein ligase RMND5A [Psilocybe cubensis]KAH9484311.1 E3 ubiquitin-protein ligase RMND5A [Psilocybe cubensis]